MKPKNIELIERHITNYAGERCPDYDAECVTCQTWELYDNSDWLRLLVIFLEADDFIKEWNAEPPTEWERANLPNDIIE